MTNHLLQEKGERKEDSLIKDIQNSFRLKNNLKKYMTSQLKI